MNSDIESTELSSLHGRSSESRGGPTRRSGERFLVGALIGLALALVLSGAANIALSRDAQCRLGNRAARWGSQPAACFSEVAHWEVSAIARGPAAADAPEAGTLMSWLSVPLAYAFVGGLIGQLPPRKALIGALIMQVLGGGLLALVAFLAVYVG